jgi:hypothetical protein
MTKLRLAAAVLVSAAMSACSTSQWSKPDATAEQVDRDNVACQREAMSQGMLRAEGFYGPGYGPVTGRFGTPLGSPGPLYDPTGNRMLDEARLTDFCMRAKGYQQAPKN